MRQHIGEQVGASGESAVDLSHELVTLGSLAQDEN